MKTRTLLPLCGALFASTLALSACGGSMDDASSGSMSPSTNEQSAASDGGGAGMAASDGGGASSSAMADPAAGLVGPGCADYAMQVPDGAGSVEGMAQDPVAVAASNNPMLTTLTQAVSGQLNPDVNLVDTLNTGEYTVFAPVDEAFAKIPEQDMMTVTGDATALTNLLTYHVVQGRLAPDQVAGTHTTVEGQDLMVEGSGDNLTVNGAHVVCGGVSTQNATVYLIDEVLMPPADSQG